MIACCYFHHNRFQDHDLDIQMVEERGQARVTHLYFTLAYILHTEIPCEETVRSRKRQRIQARCIKKSLPREENGAKRDSCFCSNGHTHSATSQLCPFCLQSSSIFVLDSRLTIQIPIAAIGLEQLISKRKENKSKDLVVTFSAAVPA